MNNDVLVRPADEQDHPFILALSPVLSEVALLDWHSDASVAKMQDEYIAKMLAPTSCAHATMIAHTNDIPLGFVHVRLHHDGISGEQAATIPLLAVSPSAQGLGVGKLLVAAAQAWGEDHGCRLLHLEVFANNTKAQRFYQKLGFKSETLHMIKTLN